MQDKKFIREEWLRFAYSYHVVRPSLHLVSKVTASLFFIMLITTCGYFDNFLDYMPKLAYLVISLIAYKAGDYLEDKVSRAIANFSFAVVRVNESRGNIGLAIGSFIILAPFFFFSAVTSFSGVKGNISTGDLGLNNAQASLTSIKKSSKGSVSEAKEELKQYQESRAEKRKEIEDGLQKLLDDAKTACDKDRSNTDYKMRTLCTKEQQSAIKISHNERLVEFDKTTERIEAEKQAIINKEQSNSANDNEQLVSMLYKEIDYKNAQIDWVGDLAGWATMLLEAFALIAAIIVSYVLKTQDAKESEMIELGEAATENIGIIRASFRGVRDFFLGSRQTK